MKIMSFAIAIASLVVPLSAFAQMQTFPGMSIPWTNLGTPLSNIPQLTTALVIDATGEKAAYCGRVFFTARTGNKDIRKVGFLFGAVTKAGGSALTVSLQNALNAGGGAALKPDETQDQTVAIANADATFAANTWHQTANLSADRTVAFGEMLCVVVEYDGSGRQGADTVELDALLSDSTNQSHGTTTTLKTGGSFTSVGAYPNIIFEFSDGTFGTVLGGFPFSALGTLTYNTGTGTADEYALEIKFPGPVQVDAAGGFVQQSGVSADAELILYDGTTAEKTHAADADFSIVAGSTRLIYGQFDGMENLSRSTTYYVSWKPTTTNNIVLTYFDVAAAGHFQAHVGGEDWRLNSRLDGGAWLGAVTTRRPFLWPYVSGIHNGVGSGGGRIIGRGQ